MTSAGGVQTATLGLPNGWFVAAASSEVPRERTLTTRFLSEEIVLYRTASGEARAVLPYCPHLGAHLGHCGSVNEETLRCGFHHFQFDGDGICVKTGYGSPPPRSARLVTKPVREQHGVILVHFDSLGQPPSWEPPALDLAGWSPVLLRRFRLRGHPQETSENSVDIGHFSIVHGFTNVRTLQDVRTDGPYLNSRYALTRGIGPGALFRIPAQIDFEVHVHGLGYSLVYVAIRLGRLRLRTRQFLFSTPTEPGRIDLRLGVSVEEPRHKGLLALLGRLLAGLIARVILILYSHDVRRDFKIWEHKRFLPHPALVTGDGPVGVFRRWARQFYSSPPF